MMRHTGATTRMDGKETPQGDAVVMTKVTKSYGSGHTAVHALREAGLRVRHAEMVVLLGRPDPGRRPCST